VVPPKLNEEDAAEVEEDTAGAAPPKLKAEDAGEVEPPKEEVPPKLNEGGE
jgi:hypothetical protein